MDIDKTLSEEKMKGIVEQIKSTPIPTTTANDLYKDIYKMFPEAKATSSQTFTGYTFKDLQDVDSRGTYVNKFDSFDLSKTIQENQEQLAQEQTSGEKWKNGILKFLGKTGTAIVGGTVGTVNGVFELMKTGNMSAIYDNSFNKRMDDLNVKMDYKLPNYYTQEEENASILGSMATANFWANDFLGGLSFTIGAIGSETIWGLATGGASLATIGAKLGAKAYAKSLAKSLYKGAFKEGAELLVDKGIKTELATFLGKAGALANTARFTYTSAGYESSIEALSYMNEMRDSFEQDFISKNGRPPTPEEYVEFNKNLIDGANSVFSMNTALVGSSNLATIGKIFNIAKPSTGLSSVVNKKLFGLGLDSTGKAVITANRAQKIAGNLYSFIKPAVVEGIFEEGGQSVVNKALTNYVGATYNPKYADNSYTLASSFAEGIEETFTTKEGWKEMWLGMLIGAVGGKGADILSGNARGELAERRAQLEAMANFNVNFSPESLSQSLIYSNRIQGASEIEDNGNNRVDNTLSRTQASVAQLNYAYNLEQYSDVVDDTLTAIRQTDEEMLAKDLGVSLSEASDYKRKIEEEYIDIQERYKKNRDFAEYYFGDSIKGKNAIETKLIKEAVAFSMTTGENILNKSKELLSSIKEDLSHMSDLTGALDLADQIATLENTTKKQIDTNLTELTKVEEEYQQALDEISFQKPNEENASRLEDLSLKVAELQKKKTELTSKLNTILEIGKVNQPTQSLNTTGTISETQLLTLKDSLDNLDTYVKELAQSSPDRGLDLSSKLTDYKEHIKAFQEFAEVNKYIASGELHLDSPKSIFGKLFREGSYNQTEAKFLDAIRNRVGENYQDYLERVSGLREAVETVKNSSIDTEIENSQTALQTLINNSSFLSQNFSEEELINSFENQEIASEFSDLLEKAKQDLNFTGKLSDIPLITTLSEVEKERLSYLAQLLGTLNISSGFENEGVTLEQLLTQANQLSVSQNLPQTNTSEIVTSDDFVGMTSESELETPNGVRQENITQTPQNVQVSFDKVGVNIHNLTLQGFLTNIDFQELGVFGKSGRLRPIDNINNIPKEIGTKVKVSFGDNALIAEINKRGGVTLTPISKNKDLTVMDILNQNTGYNVVKYSFGASSRYSFLYLNGKPLDSDFEISPRYNFQAIYDLKTNEMVKFEVDANDIFNQTLTDKSEEEIVKLVKIYVVDSRGNVVGELKSQDGTYGSDGFNMLRLEASRMLKEGGGILNYEAPVNRVFLGTPNLTIDENGQPITFTPSTENIVDFGYSDNGKLKLRNNTETSSIRKDFIQKLSQKPKVPVIIFRHGAQKIAIPIRVKGVESQAGQVHLTALETNENTASKVINLNSDLIAKGYKTSFYFNSPTEQNIYNESGDLRPEVLQAIDYLNKVQKLPNLMEISVEELASISETPVDFSNNPVTSPKIRLDFDNLIQVDYIQSEVDTSTIKAVTEDVNKGIEEVVKPSKKPRKKVEPVANNINEVVTETPIEDTIEQEHTAKYSVIALDYLFTGGRGAILSTDYFLQALVGGFTHASSEIDAIRIKYANQIGNLSTDIGTDLYNNMVQEIRDVISNRYSNKKAIEIFDNMVKNSTGYVSRVGNKVSIELEQLNEEQGLKQTAPLQVSSESVVTSQTSLPTEEPTEVRKPVKTKKPKVETSVGYEIPNGILLEERDGYANYTIPPHSETDLDYNNQLNTFIYNRLLDEGDFIYPTDSKELLEFRRGRVVNKENGNLSKEFGVEKPSFTKGVTISKKKSGKRTSKRKEMLKIDDSLRNRSQQEQNKKC